MATWPPKAFRFLSSKTGGRSDCPTAFSYSNNTSTLPKSVGSANFNKYMESTLENSDIIEMNIFLFCKWIILESWMWLQWKASDRSRAETNLLPTVPKTKEPQSYREPVHHLSTRRVLSGHRRTQSIEVALAFAVIRISKFNYRYQMTITLKLG